MFNILKKIVYGTFIIVSLFYILIKLKPSIVDSLFDSFVARSIKKFDNIYNTGSLDSGFIDLTKYPIIKSIQNGYISNYEYIKANNFFKFVFNQGKINNSPEYTYMIAELFYKNNKNDLDALVIYLKLGMNNNFKSKDFYKKIIDESWRKYPQHKELSLLYAKYFLTESVNCTKFLSESYFNKNNLNKIINNSSWQFFYQNENSFFTQEESIILKPDIENDSLIFKINLQASTIRIDPPSFNELKIKDVIINEEELSIQKFITNMNGIEFLEGDAVIENIDDPFMIYDFGNLASINKIKIPFDISYPKTAECD